MELNTNRLCQVIRWNWIADLRKTRNGLIGAFIGMLCASLMGTGFIWNWQPVSLMQVANISHVVLFVIGFIMLYYAAIICSKLRAKTEYINYAMLPASKLEKFVASWIHITIIPFLVMIVGFLAGDIIQMLLTGIITGSFYSYTLQMILIFWRFVAENAFGFSIGHMFAILIVLMFLHSTFILGGCFFRKHPMLFTCIVWVAIPVALSAVVAFCINYVLLFFGQDDLKLCFEWADGTVPSIICDVILVALIVFNYWMSFRIWSRQQIINNTFYN